MNPILKKYSKKLRIKRIKTILEKCMVDESMSILDIGGTEHIWKDINWKGKVVLANLTAERGGWNTPPLSMSNLEYRFLDEQGLSIFGDKEFDFVFSNSVIEHLKTFEMQKLFATETQRIGRGWAVQTPNKYFFIEPHFMFPYANQLPCCVRKLIVKYWPLRVFEIKDLHIAMGLRSLSIKDIRELFSSGVIITERLFGMVKSIIAINHVQSSHEKKHNVSD